MSCEWDNMSLKFWSSGLEIDCVDSNRIGLDCENSNLIGKEVGNFDLAFFLHHHRG